MPAGVYQRTPLAERFWSKVDRSGGPDACWPWTGAKQPKGYGRLWNRGRVDGAHRVAWELANGEPVPEGRHVLHHCDNPPCCNPAHLFLGDYDANMQDCASKGRLKQQRCPEVVRGERNANARLTEADVREIRRLQRQGVSRPAIARRFDVTRECVYSILKGKTWRHVA